MTAFALSRRLARAAVILALLAGCKDNPTDPGGNAEVEFIGIVEGIARTGSGAPLDSVRILPIGAADDAIYSFAQALTGQDGRFSITVYRKGTVANKERIELTVNVIATPFKGYNENPDGPFQTRHVTVTMEFVAPGLEPTPAYLEITL